MATMLLVMMAVAAGGACAATRWLIPRLWKWGFWDLPNHRSSHSTPKPRGGGLAVWTGVALAVAVAFAWQGVAVHWSILAGTAAVALVGVADDRLRGVSARLRLMVQLLAAGLVTWQCGGIERLPLPAPADLPAGWWAAPLAVLWLVGVTNLVNFLDGIDGFAALQGALTGLGLALLAPDGATLACAAAVAGACLGFLPFNWQPSKVFLGDVGAPPLGFLLAALPFQSPPAQRGLLVWTAALLLWFFLADGVFTLLRRLVRGEPWWQAHRSHLYQRLVAAGASHASVAGGVMLLAALLGAATVASALAGRSRWQWLVQAAAVAALAAYAVWTRRCERAWPRASAPPAAAPAPPERSPAPAPAGR